MGAECPHCGGPNPPEATVCQWCGSAIALPEPRLVPPASNDAELVVGEPIETSSRSSAGVISVIIIIAIVVIAGSLAAVYSPKPPSGHSLEITGLYVKSPDNACGLNGDDSGNIDLSPPGGGFPVISWGLPGPGGELPCTVTTASTNTSGFQLVGSFPYKATSFPGILVVSIIAPASFQGVLNVTFT
jgi:hypothetical protein